METFIVFKVFYCIFATELTNKMKDNILKKAADMFITLGFKSVTMDDIANEMSISKKTIYQHFSNKTELVKNVTTYVFSSIACGIDEIIEQSTNPIEELYDIKQFVLLQLKNEAVSPSYQLQKYYPKIYIKLKKMHFEKMHVCIINNINKGIKMGLYREGVNTELICRFYFSGMTNIKDEELFPSASFDPIAVQNEFLEYHLRGVCTLKGIEKVEQLIKQNTNYEK